MVSRKAGALRNQAPRRCGTSAVAPRRADRTTAGRGGLELGAATGRHRYVSQPVGVIDAVPSRAHRPHQRHHLGHRMERSRAGATAAVFMFPQVRGVSRLSRTVGDAPVAATVDRFLLDDLTRSYPSSPCASCAAEVSPVRCRRLGHPAVSGPTPAGGPQIDQDHGRRLWVSRPRLLGSPPGGHASRPASRLAGVVAGQEGIWPPGTSDRAMPSRMLDRRWIPGPDR